MKLDIFNHQKIAALEQKVATLEKGIKLAQVVIRSIEEKKQDIDFDKEEIPSEEKELFDALFKLKKELEIISIEEEKRNWANEGLTFFVNLLRQQYTSSEEMYDKLLSNIIKYIKANQGNIFIKEEENDEEVLNLKAAYAYDRKRYQEKTISVKHGLIGQTFSEGSYQIIKNVPKDYLHITSGLGEDTPKFLLLMPLVNNGDKVGIIELASFKPFEDHVINFLEKLSESIASIVISNNITETTKSLLDQSKIQQEELQEKEEELRQNMEEMRATQEASEGEKIKNRAILDNCLDGIVLCNTEGYIEYYNPSFEKISGYEKAELDKKVLKDFFPKAIWEEAIYPLFNSDYNTEFNTQINNSENKSLFIDLGFSNFTFRGDKKCIFFFRDITDDVAKDETIRQKMEEIKEIQQDLQHQLKDSNELKNELETRQLVLNETTILSESDLFGTITFASKKLEELSQYSQKEMLGKGHNLFRHPDMPASLFKLLWETIKSGETFRGIVKNKKKDGGIYWVDAVIMPIKNDNGQIYKYISARYHIKNEAYAQTLFDQQIKELNLS